jgi:ATP-dependent helicase IRC3
MSILSHFDPAITSPDPKAPSSGVPIIGFSATFGRHDGLALGAIFDHIIYHHDVSDMIKDKWFGSSPFIYIEWRFHLDSFTGSVNSALPQCRQI